ncbi:MAG: hypothetical protein ABIK09_02375 [Pseudomonadota bacterium]
MLRWGLMMMVILALAGCGTGTGADTGTELWEGHPRADGFDANPEETLSADFGPEADGPADTHPPQDTAPLEDAPPLEDTPPPDLGTPLGDFELVFYWMAFEADHPGPPEVALEDNDGAVLAVVSQGFADTIMLEGSGRLLDGRILNLEDECPDAPTGWCYFEVDGDLAPYGLGSSGALEPFRSVAMDEDLGLAGQHLYAPALDGLTLPSMEFIGPIHDGCLVVKDTGWSLGSEQVDLYVYLEAHHVPLDAAISTDAFPLFVNSPLCP